MDVVVVKGWTGVVQGSDGLGGGVDGCGCCEGLDRHGTRIRRSRWWSRWMWLL